MRMFAAENLDLPDAQLQFWPQALNAAAAEEAFAALQDEIAWRQESIHIFGRWVKQPRLSAWYGDPQAVYRYSGRRFMPLPWTPMLATLRQRAESLTGARFNSVLANLYRDGDDAMGWHADDEPELGAQPVIASLSLGATRSFRLRHRQREDLGVQRLPLTDGSLLCMTGPTQQHWQHAIPRERRVRTPRINLTFRYVVGAMA